MRNFINWLLCGGIVGMIGSLFSGFCWFLSDRTMSDVGKLYIWKNNPDTSLIIISSFLTGLGFSLLFIMTHKNIRIPYPFRGAILGGIIWFGFIISGIIYYKSIMIIPNIYLFNMIFISLSSIIIMGLVCEVVYEFLSAR
ncbi:MAG: hypothetical protein ACUVWP_03615 [bacterium]